MPTLGLAYTWPYWLNGLARYPGYGYSGPGYPGYGYSGCGYPGYGGPFRGY
ncbi:hypothetical protein [Desulfosporosinus sp. BICA1-9]|uniref:hypothetical protein n=1 Tax=Desulfosporosinus sp. BICA1-9 TaxID=1531958 RepID=UPI0025BFBE22|nr:hypothetical protein [Desulfosporosinus sp. BICA1-9]